jgi:predicted kinase
MTFNEALKLIRDTQPPVVYLGGKTSTGKSTFAGQLREDLEYRIVELDKVVLNSVIVPLRISNPGEVFNEVYKKRDKIQWIQQFIKAADNEIRDITSKGHRVVVDGTVANPETLRELLSSLPEVAFLYFHPTNLVVYERNLTNRFRQATASHSAGLPTQFWDLVDKDEFKKFCKTGIITTHLRAAISEYARQSQQSSTQRIEKQSALAPEMKIVNI